MYHDAHRCFPPAAITAPDDRREKLFESFDGFGWQTMILPYIDRQVLYDSITPDGRFGAFTWHYLETGQIDPGCDIVIPLYRCPSSALPSHATDLGPRPVPPFRLGYAVTDYKGCAGGVSGGVIVRSGVDGAVRLRSITDGASQTFLAGESSYPGTTGSALPLWAGYVGSPGTGIFITAKGHTIDCGMQGRSGQFWVRARSPLCASSFHNGGAQFVFADGHARFISKDIDADVYKYFGGRSDGRAIPAY